MKTELLLVVEDTVQAQDLQQSTCNQHCDVANTEQELHRLA